MNGVLDYPVWTHFSHFEFWILPNFDLWSQENVDILYSKQLKLCQIKDVKQNVLNILMIADESCISLPCLDTF